MDRKEQHLDTYELIVMAQHEEWARRRKQPANDNGRDVRPGSKRGPVFDRTTFGRRLGSLRGGGR
jgi:hypothetical protein